MLRRLFIQTITILSLLFLFFSAHSQNNLPLANTYNYPIQQFNAQLNSNIHSSILPFRSDEFADTIFLDSLEASRNLVQKFYSIGKTTKTNYLQVIPLVESSFGYGINDTNNVLYSAGIGVNVSGNVSNKLGFETYYLLNQQTFPSYVEKSINENDVVPQQGYAFGPNNKPTTREWGGYVSYSPNTVFNFQLGHGKNFWGNGYRSLLLSDVAPNYSYFKISTQVGPFKYINLYANFRDIGNQEHQTYWNYSSKFGAMHYLSWNVSKRWNISLFESVIWSGSDTLGNRNFDVNYINPVIFYRPVEFSIGSSDNSMMGLNLSYKLTPSIQLYSQIAIDEFLLKEVRADFTVAAKKVLNKEVTDDEEYGWSNNKQSMQIGLKWFNFFSVKNLLIQLEHNRIRPYMYSHISGKINYGHLNSSLAHPFGANFHETIFLAHYFHKSFHISYKGIYAIRGLDVDSKNFGQNIYKPYYSAESTYFNAIGQGLKSTFIFNELQVGYTILPQTGLKAFVSIQNRIEQNQVESTNNSYIILGITSQFNNRYRDF